MTRFFSRLGAAAATALLSLSLSAGAATLGLEQQAAPAVNGSGTIFGGDLFGGLTIFGSGDGTAPAAASGLAVNLTTQPGNATGGFNISSPASGQYLVGDLVDFGFVFDVAGADRLELLFSVTGGTAASAFGGRVLAFVTGEFGTDASALSTGIGPTFAGIRIAAPVPIPLPAAPVLLLSGLAAFGAIRHRRRASA